MNIAPPAAEAPPRGCHVGPMPQTTFWVEPLLAHTSEGPKKIVRLRFEHSAGSTELIVEPEFAKQLAAGLTRAATGIEIAGG